MDTAGDAVLLLGRRSRPGGLWHCGAARGGSRGGSQYMWSLAPGARLTITLPVSLLSIDWARRHYCLIAGGIGITPQIGAAQAIARRDSQFTLHYAVPSRDQAVYLDVLVPLLNERLNIHASNEGRRLDFDDLFAPLPPDALTLLCGPMRMLDTARRAWTGAGRALSDLRHETFGSSGSLPTEGFRVCLADPAIELVIPRDRSLLDVLNEAGYDVIADCRRGECGVCAIDLVNIDGELDHRDVFFSEQQKRANARSVHVILALTARSPSIYYIAWTRYRLVAALVSAVGPSPALGTTGA